MDRPMLGGSCELDDAHALQGNSSKSYIHKVFTSKKYIDILPFLNIVS